jgi:AcrR family transcriptional regulator
VRAAVSLLETRPLAELSLREVARIAGVSNGAPYRHFKRRADLLVAVALEGFAALDRVLTAVDASEHPAGERLEQRTLAYMRFAVAHGPHYRVMFSPELRESENAATYDRVARASFAGLVEAVLTAQPRLDAGHASEVALALWSGAHGAALLAIDGTLSGLAASGPKRDALLVTTARHLTRIAISAGT